MENRPLDLLRPSVTFAVQLVIFLIMHAFWRLADVELANLFTVDTISVYFQSITVGLLWVSTFYQLFPGQHLVSAVLTLGLLVLAVLIVKRRGEWGYALTFHVLAICWTMLPVFAFRYGSYYGP